MQRLTKLTEEARAEGKEIVVVMGAGFVGAVMAAVVASTTNKEPRTKNQEPFSNKEPRTKNNFQNQEQLSEQRTILLDTLVTSKTRIKLLVKFFLNGATRSYLRDLETEFDESTNAIRQELNRFEEAGMLNSEVEGNKKIFFANTGHPLFGDIHNILLKYTGIDKVVEHVLQRIGGLQEAWLIGDFAKGKDSPVIDLVLVGDAINTEILLAYIGKASEISGRKIRYLIFRCDEKEIIKVQWPERLLLFAKKYE